MLKNVMALLGVLLVMSCQTLDQGQGFSVSESETSRIERSSLESWWSFFGDPSLDKLVSSALGLNARINSKSKIFPEDNMTDEALSAYYKDPRVSLVKSVVRDYIEYRYIQNKNHLLMNYIEELEFAHRGSGDVHSNILKRELDALHARKDEFQMRLDDMASKIAVSTKLLPEYVTELIKEVQPIPFYDITPVLLEDSSDILSNTSRIKAASALLFHNTKGRVLEKAAQDVFPKLPLNQLFGISDQVFAQSESPWRVSIGHAVRSLNFDDLESKILYKDKVDVFRDSVFSYVLDIERLLVGYSMLIEQSKVLETAANQAHDNDVYKARLATLRARYEKAKAVAELFDALDLY